MNLHLRRLALAGATLAVLAGAAQAQPGPDRRDSRARPPAAFRTPHIRFDPLYRHDHYYPAPGYAVPTLPMGSLSIRFGNASFFFHSGVWYRPSGSRFVVVLPPVGIYVSVLPPAFVTLWLAGSVYYYANGVYYAPAGSAGYVVVAPPPGADSAQPAAAPEPIFYPRNGQSPEQTEADRRECNRWATTQPNAVADASVFQRAVAACMDGRGYTVR
jgi:hypothetical protein